MNKELISKETDEANYGFIMSLKLCVKDGYPMDKVVDLAQAKIEAERPYLKDEWKKFLVDETLKNI